MIERAAYAEALFEESERAQVTFNSIGEAVVSTNASDQITYLDAVAEDLTGWSLRDARGRPLQNVLQIIDVTTRQPALNPMTRAVRDNNVVALAFNCVLIRRDGGESAIEDSVAPIQDRKGAVAGAVMVFHDVGVSRALSLKMSYLAQHDSLTEELDHFKHISDSLGHIVGDLFLQSVARRLFSCVRSSDTVARRWRHPGKNLRMQVVAEGVKTRQQLELLKEHGCSQAQGYFSRLLRGKALTTASA